MRSAGAPVEAVRRIVELTFDFDETHPRFLALVNIENVNHGRYISKFACVRKPYSDIAQITQSVLDRGIARGQSRAEIDATDVWQVFNCGRADPDTKRRHRRMIADAVGRFLSP